jgi:23S rRNA (cytosine1962-C5)-methyltransferase
MSARIDVTKKGAQRALSGHLWIYRSDIASSEGVPGGTVVDVVDEKRRFVGKALYSDKSEIAVRLLTTANERIDQDWWRRRIRAAIERRAGIAPDATAYRVIYSEGDLMPSLIVDRYDDVLVMQTLSQGTEALKPLLTELLVEEFHPTGIVERNDVKVRLLEGLELSTGLLYGSVPDKLRISQHGIDFLIEPLGGQKTGSFLDQRENRLAARALAFGRGLDCFTFNGAFALHLAEKCDSVLGLDISADAITSARRNAELNNAANVDFQEANVFDALRELESAGEKFDTIVLDPPAFAKNRASVRAAVRGYKEINLRAMKLLNPGGVLITCTCSYHMQEQMFLDMIADAAVDAKRRIQLVEKRMQSSDHPVLVNVPETYYLKCVIARVLE